MSNATESMKHQLDREFPGNRIQCMPTRHAADIASVLSGDRQVDEVPWILPVNRKILKNRRELASKRRFDRNNPKEMEQYSKLLTESTRDRVVAREVADYRQFELTSDVMAIPFALSAFQTINLSEGELPLVIRPRSKNYQRFTVRSVGQDGGARQDQWRTTKEASTYEMDILSTDKVEYPLIDIQQGSIPEVDNVNADLRFDMEMKIDKLAQDNIDALAVASGLRDLLHLHPLVVASNIPDKNYLDLSGVDAAGVLSITKLKTILKHVNQFGSVGGLNEKLTISSIVYSPQNVQDPWDFVDLVAGYSLSNETVAPSKTVPTSVREAIFDSGMITSAWGNTFSWQTNSRLAKGRMYVFTSQPIGWFFTKTEFDQLLVWEGPDQQEQNYGQIVWRRVMKFVCPDVWKYRVVIVDL